MENKKCDYGCGKKAKFKLKSGKWCCSKHHSGCSKIKEKNSNGMKKAWVNGVYKNIDTFHGTQNWKKGLTIADPRVKRNVEARKKALKTEGYDYKGIGRTHSEETKEKISKARTKFLESNNNHGIEWFEVNGIKVQGTWELKVANWLMDNNIRFERNKVYYKIHRRYTPDFFLPEYNFYIEVKGYMKDNDLQKMFLVLEENDIDIRIINKDNINDINIDKLPKFIDLYSKKDINYDYVTIL